MREYFFVLILLLLLLINLYVVIKLSHHIPILKKNRILKWGLLFYGFSYLLGVYFVEHFNKNFVGDFLTFSGGIYLAFLNYMFLTFILIDIFYIIKKIFRLSNIVNDKVVYKIGIIFSILIVVVSFINTMFFNVKNYKIYTDKNINNKRIVFISDIHLANDSIPVYWEKVVDKINSLNPDYILIGGDIIDRDAEIIDKNKFQKIFLKMKARDGVYAILGNHEYYGDLDKNIDYIKKCNILLLKDSIIEKDKFLIIGREDRHNRNRKNLKELIDDKQDEKFKIVLDHAPTYFNESLNNKVDLQLSGHTHNGQFFPWNLITNYIYEVSSGKITKEKSTLIVSSGIGGWGPKIRNFSTPQIILIEIKQKKNK